MSRVDRESAERRERKKQARRAANRKQAKQRRTARLIRLQLPRSVSKNRPIVVRIRHDFPESLGEQSVHVTLKPGDNQGRLERKVVKGAGQGELEVTFELPHDCAESTVRIAAFVGKDYQSNLQHVVSKPIPVGD
jgi:hypothetical protein